MARGRKGIEIDRQILESIINDLESKNNYSSRMALYDEVANQYFLLKQTKISGGLVSLRVSQWGLKLKTDKAKAEPWKHKSTPIVESDNEIILNKQLTTDLLMYADEKEKKKFLPLAKKVLRGSRNAAIHMTCMSCANWQKEEVKFCEVKSCPLWSFRKYQ